MATKAKRPHWQDDELRDHRIAMDAKHTAGLRPGWYVLTGFFWHDTCSVISGPYSTNDDAWTCRTTLEHYGIGNFYLDEVVAAAGLGQP
jgi:hypothetical protein